MLINFIHTLQRSMLSVINFILLSLIYFFGIGLTAVLAKANRKSFLSSRRLKSKKSNFAPFVSNSNLEKMF